MAASSSTTGPELGKALVTGATSGIGRAAALRLARDGWEVIVQGRNAERGAGVVRAIEEQGGRARFVAADLNDSAAVRALVEDVGSVDVLVNNAGTRGSAPARISTRSPSTTCSMATCARRTFSSPGLSRVWRSGPRAASSASPAWPVRSGWPVALRTVPPRPPSAP